jgi:hypothetical protein
MKKNTNLGLQTIKMKFYILLFFIGLSFLTLSQSPLGINYQAVLRNSTGVLVANTTVGYKLEIRKTSSTGQVVYAERHTPLSNSQALINIIIGGGTVLQGSFSSITWGAGPYFLVSSIDFSGGTNYQNFGSQQLMSVPYALYANTAGAAINKWLYGTTSPLSTLGTAGDYYLNTTNGSISYNNNGTWGVIGNLTGPQGQTGSVGAQGPSGPTGLTGATGNGISSVIDNGDGTLTFYFTNGTNFTTSNLTGPTGVQGPSGTQGPIGLTGPQGVAGVNGINGQNSLVKTSVESIGANCATGGVKLEYGLDANSNSILDVSEVNSSLTKYVCNGANGAQGATGPQGVAGAQGPVGSPGPAGTNGTNGQNSLVKTTTESVGANCSTGGVKLEYGLDGNSNGILDISEVNSSLTKYVCNGAIGATGAQGPIGLSGPQGPAGTLPSGSINQTFRHDGSTWVANSLITNTGMNVGIGTTNPNSSAILNVNSTTQGILLPTMTLVQRNSINSPATGLLVFQTDNTPGFYYFNGTVWVAIAGSSGSASSGSNANTLIYTSDGF